MDSADRDTREPQPRQGFVWCGIYRKSEKESERDRGREESEALGLAQLL